MKRLIAVAVLVVVMASLAGATVTVTGHVKLGNTGIPDPSQVKVTFSLQNCIFMGQNTPRVIGVTNFVDVSFTVTPGADGAWTVTTYGNDVITCDVLGNSQWKIGYTYKNSVTSYNTFTIPDGGTFNIDNASPTGPAQTAYTPLGVILNPPGNASQSIAGPLSDPYGFVGPLTGNVTGNVSGSAGSVTGNAATATALAANGSNCSGNNFALGVDASGNGECAQPSFGNLSGAWIKAQAPASNVYTDQANAYVAGFAQSLLDGSNTTIGNAAAPTKKAQFDVSNITAGQTRTINVPDANSTTVQSITSSASQWLASMSAQGAFTKSQPAFSDISGVSTKAQAPATDVYADQTNTFTLDQFFKSGRPWVDAMGYALCDNSTDDSTALQNAATAAAGGLLYVPPKATCLTGSSIVLPTNTSLYLAEGSSIKARAAIAGRGIVELPTASASDNPQIWGGGMIDCNGLADIGLWARRFLHHANIHDFTINDCQVNALRLGDSSFANADGAYVTRLNIRRPSAHAVVAGSVGIWASAASDGGGDSVVDGNLIVGYEKGIKADTSGNTFRSNHPWAFTPSQMLKAFEDTAVGNAWINNYADTAATYGFHLTSTAQNTVIQGGRIFNNGSGADNTMVGIQIDQANPFMTIENVHFYGVDASHRIATDVVSGAGFSNIQTFGNQVTNVVTTNVGRVRATSETLSASGSQVTLTDSASANGVQLVFGSKDNGSGQNLMDFTPTSLAGQGSSFRLCRSTNNAAGCSLTLFKGDNTATSEFVANSSGLVQIGGNISPVTTGSGTVGSASAAWAGSTYGDTSGSQWIHGVSTELLTLSTSGTTTDTAANLLPSSSIIDAIVVRVTTTITTATNWSVGDPTTAARFCAVNSTLTAGTTSTCTLHADQTGAAGPRQVAAAKVRITTTGTPGAGAIRITVFYRQFVAPTS